ncbi:MAG TPA: alkaline phosphatase PafA [Chitinophagaceae bacterium]|jgi:predicted AlkP superfamily pyrophosphatase or phosphodiesterase|nr:alkaline phosphatase PafA [Chitinophagaceae bacterium]
MKKIGLLVVAYLSLIAVFAQPAAKTTPIQRPKLVVGIVVDQMRWDFLYRYYERYGSGGFKRLINDGFSCENAMINYIPSFTAVGHATIFTGSVPAIDGIAGNDWIDQLTGKHYYCTDDSTVQPVGAARAVDGKMSPRNLLVSTITDELRIATNFQSRVVGVSMKDRASILPAGHSANAAFWLDDSTGHFITSTYYMKELPEWVVKFNNQNRINQLIEKGWNTLYPINTYKQSDADNKEYEGKYPGETNTSFPHDLKTSYSKSKYSFRPTPFGNTITLEFAKQALEAYQLGRGVATDFLTINFASTDYVGHQFGPNSIEIEDTYLRLDKDLVDLFQTLDTKIGKGQYLVFLTADHGVAHNIGFMQSHELPADFWYATRITDSLNKMLSAKFHISSLVRSITNYKVNFDLNKIAAENLNFDLIKNATVDYLQRQPGISFAVNMDFIGRYPIPKRLQEMMINGYYFKRSGQVQIILNPGWFDAYSKTGTTHGTWNPYDTHIPLLWYGWNIKPGKLNREVYMTDISPTLAALLHIQMPNGCIGHVIEEIVK